MGRLLEVAKLSSRATVPICSPSSPTELFLPVPDVLSPFHLSHPGGLAAGVRILNWHLRDGGRWGTRFHVLIGRLPIFFCAVSVLLPLFCWVASLLLIDLWERLRFLKKSSRRSSPSTPVPVFVQISQTSDFARSARGCGAA